MDEGSGTAAASPRRSGLASAYRTSLRLADELGARLVTFPAISTRVYGYPLDRAADVTHGPSSPPWWSPSQLVRWLRDVGSADSVNRGS